MTETQEKNTVLPELIKNGKQPVKVCFVCTGNTCRSPMAEALLNFYGKGMYKASSAGIMAEKGAPMTDKAMLALEKHGIEPVPGNDFKKHQAKQIDEKTFEENDRVICVSKGHTMLLLQYFPQYAGKLDSFDSPVSDPFGKGQDEYDACLCDILENIKQKFVLPE